MRAVAQRVSRAAVRSDGELLGEITRGLVVLLGVGPTDTDSVATRLAGRIATLRIFADQDGRMNRDVSAAGGSVLVVSQFTLHGDASRGHRPSFVRAREPVEAARLCTVFVDALRDCGLTIATGRFGAHMEVELVNDGPVTLVLSSGEPPWAADAG